jgi:hypothetical protein
VPEFGCKEILMVRVLVLIAVMIFCREVVVRKRRRLLTANPPYMNALDGAMSAQQTESGH